MSKLVFIRDFNPAYDIILFQYFRVGGIPISDDLTLEEAEAVWNSLHQRVSERAQQLGSNLWFRAERETLKPHELLFYEYVRAWKNHPYCRPSHYGYLARMLRFSKRATDVQELAKLQCKLSGQKLLFAEEDVAKDIYDYYRHEIKTPLKKILSSPAPAEATKEKLLEFLEREDYEKLRGTPPDKDAKAIRKIAQETLESLEQGTPQKILEGIGRLSRSIWDSVLNT